jgi:hypothetical protein
MNAGNLFGWWPRNTKLGAGIIVEDLLEAKGD